MKKVLAIIMYIYCGPVLAQNKIPDGFGAIRMGETEVEIFNALHIDAADIVDGSSETLQQFRQNVYQKVVRVRYDESSQLMKDIDVKKRKHLGGAGVLPETYLFECAELDQYFIPQYKFDSITIKGFLLTFYQHKLVRIKHDLIAPFNGPDILRQSLDDLLYYFKQQDTSYSKYYHMAWDADQCGYFPTEEVDRWPDKASIAGPRVRFENDTYCGGKNIMVDFYLEIIDMNFLSEMETVCPDIDDK